MQLFIAVINENFDVAEELKKGKQATHYLALQQPVQASPTWLRRLNPYRWFKANPKSIAVENLPSSLVLPMQKSVMESNSYAHSDAASEKVNIFLVMLIVCSDTFESSEGNQAFYAVIIPPNLSSCSTVSLPEKTIRTKYPS